MGSSRWDPTEELMQLHDRMNRLFGVAHGREAGDDQLTGQWSPACDILETRDFVILRAEVPGIKEKDLDIAVESGLLTLRGQRTFEKETEESSYHRIERAYGRFVRSFSLPRSVDADRISASFQDGVLEVRMPKREETQPRHIRIGTSSNQTTID